MFGYVVPIKEELRQQDYVLYKSFYCGICKSIGQNYGQLPRFTTTYDVTFLSLLVFDQLNADVTFAEEKCVGNPFVKRVVVKNNALLDRLAAANIILSYHKVRDDIIDGQGKGKRLMLRAMKKPYLKAQEVCPEIDATVKQGYAALREAEQNREAGIDRAAHPFSQLLADTACALVGENSSETLEKLFYNIGKFVYLVDALDDIDEDAKSGNYNPLLIHFNNYQSRRQFIDDNRDALGFIFAGVINRAIACFNSLEFHQSYTLLENIVHKGLRHKVDELLLSDKKIDRPRL